MTKTAYADRLSAEELAERSKDMSPEAREEWRVENATSPLFDMWLRFEAAFANRAIDRLDISTRMPKPRPRRWRAGHGPEGAAFAHLLRQIPHRRILRAFCHKANAVWAAGGVPEMLPIAEVHERYEKLPKGEA